MDYNVVVVREENSSYAKAKLVSEVKKMINSGWKIQGGVSVSINPFSVCKTIIMAQAMIKED